MKRRDFLTLSIKAAMAAGYTSAIPASLLYSHTSHAAILGAGLSDPAMQPLFVNPAPNALDSNFKYVPKNDRLKIAMGQTQQLTGLVGADGVTPVPTTVWGYGDGKTVSWPGKTFERHVNDAPLQVTWENRLVDGRNRPLPHLLPVDTSLHWCYSLPGYEQYSIANDGVPLVPHMHGGKNDSAFDGNPEFFFSPGSTVQGPRYVDDVYSFGGPDWNDAAGMMWYHDHALGITRLNVYAGLAGFFALRDDNDTGGLNNPAGLPGGPYELAYAVQDRMFRNTGELFYPAFPGDWAYDDFIYGEGAILPPDLFPGGGPTALAEFFGDHMVVNGVLWPKVSVEPRQYRVRLLNGTDSRFMRLRLKVIRDGASGDPANDAVTNPAASDTVLPFYIVGADQSLTDNARQVTEVDFLPGERLDLVIDFKGVMGEVDILPGDRVIVENILGDAPFGGDLPDPDDLFPDRRTDRVMAFDVEKRLKRIVDTSVGNGSFIGGGFVNPESDDDCTVRKLALFEGTDHFGRLQPLIGTAEETLDVKGNWANGTLPWFAPVTENPGVGETEIWEIYNTTGDAHPIHVHLIHFEVLNRQYFDAPLMEKPLPQHDGEVGTGYEMGTITLGDMVPPSTIEASEQQIRRDMVMALPGQVTRIKMTFTKPGRYVWHCHILSHEDHEMMRPFHVGPGPF